MEKIHFEALMCVCAAHWDFHVADIEAEFVFGESARKLEFKPISVFALTIQEPLAKPRKFK